MYCTHTYFNNNAIQVTYIKKEVTLPNALGVSKLHQITSCEFKNINEEAASTKNKMKININ